MRLNTRCEMCGEAAEFVVRRVWNSGRSTERNLCGTCARNAERVFSGRTAPLATELLSKLLAEEEVFDSQQNRTKVCPKCGNNVEEITRSGVMGCPQCYVSFRDEVDDVVAQIHGKPGSENAK